MNAEEYPGLEKYLAERRPEPAAYVAFDDARGPSTYRGEVVDNAEDARTLLAAALPGFEATVDAAADAVRVRGGFRIGADVGNEVLFWVPPEGVAGIVRSLVDSMRRRVIDAAGLEPVIANREAAAREQGHRNGYSVGHYEGKAEGRREAIAEFAEALRAGLPAIFHEGADDE